MIEAIPWKDCFFIHDSDGHRCFLDAEELHITAHMLENGVWEPQVRQVFQQVLYHGATYVDVGANVGLHCLYAAGLIGGSESGGRMFCFEPNKRVNQILQNNLELNGFLSMTKIFDYAVSDFEGETKFYVYENHPGMSGMMAVNDECPLAKKREETVHTVTLDSILRNLEVDLLKIDVEGFEWNVLRGGAECIERNQDKITVIIEWHPTEAAERNGVAAPRDTLEFFERYGFFCYRAQFMQPIQKMNWGDKEQLLQIPDCDLVFTKRALNAVGE